MGQFDIKVDGQSIQGQRITAVRHMRPFEMKLNMWDDGYTEAPLVIVLSNGVKLYPSSDCEGNTSGCLFSSYNGKLFILG